MCRSRLSAPSQIASGDRPFEPTPWLAHEARDKQDCTQQIMITADHIYRNYPSRISLLKIQNTYPWSPTFTKHLHSRCARVLMPHPNPIWLSDSGAGARVSKYLAILMLCKPEFVEDSQFGCWPVYSAGIRICLTNSFAGRGTLAGFIPEPNSSSTHFGALYLAMGWNAAAASSTRA